MNTRRDHSEVAESRAATSASMRLLGLLVAASVLIPVILFGIFAWLSYRDRFADAQVRLERTLDGIHEHATRVFETHELIAQRVDDLLSGVSDADIRAREPELHERLQAFRMRMPQLQDIWVIDATGHPLVTANAFPAPRDLNLSDREYFRVHIQSPGPPYVSELLTSRLTGASFFEISRRRTDAEGKFRGIIAISAAPGYFRDFYASFAPSYSMTLFREDGALLARYPDNGNLPKMLPPGNRFVPAVRTSPQNGSFQVNSLFDGKERIVVYRRLQDYPVYVTVSESTKDIRAEWLQFLASHLMFSVPATAGLFLISILAFAQARREHRSLERLQHEIALRQSTEAQLIQAQKMEAVGRLTGGIAHDFNNLLTVIMGNIEVVSRQLPDASDRVKRAIQNALRGAERAAALTHRLLAFSRRQPLEAKPVDLNALVSGMTDLVRRTIGESIAIEARLAAGLWTVLADSNQTENALLNLIINARDAMSGKGSLTIETANLDSFSEEESEALPPGEYVRLSVSDTGTGMAPEILDKAFEPFFTTKSSGQGTGLGLSMVYGFMQQSNGHIRIHSQVDHGTVVHLYFPKIAGPTETAPVREDGNRAEPPGNGETILVCEDEQAVRDFSSQTLLEHGYKIVEAADMDEALAQLDRHPDVSVLFTDIVLPGAGNGRVLANEALRRRPDLKVLFTTGYARDAINLDGRIDEGMALLNKPFTAEELARRMRSLLEA